MIPLDLTSLLHDRLRADRRPEDGLLHASSDLLGSLRHSQLRLAGAPTISSEITSDVRLMTGTMWHNFLHESLVRKGVAFMQEIRVTPWLPEGWGGTADWLFWDADARGFVLGDLKTTKGEGMKWLKRDGAKQEHLWQLSAYWHALYDSGLPMVKGFGVLYLPMNDTTDKDERIEPVVMECDIVDRGVIHSVMEQRWALTARYLRSISSGGAAGDYINEFLAPEQAREQKVYWNGKASVFDVKLVPHWSAQFCPYPEELCACSAQGTTKIGQYALDGTYTARTGYESELPMVEPSEIDYRRKRKEAENKDAGSIAGAVVG